ncbi:MAG: threonine--tRNA ligase, partial [Parcubacteria group bacterium RIFCSPHIGHO2_01_FULL_40_30]
PGAPFWHHKGMVIFKELEKYIRELQDKNNYQEISTPIMVKKSLFEKSGHWEFFKQNMFNFDVENEIYSLKPMNCPESALVYQTKIRSYRDLPLRLAELGRLHRNELSGVLGGLFRVRQFTMDDAHIYCRQDQIKSEFTSILKMTEEFYKKLGLPVSYGLATRPEKAMGDKKLWDEAEIILKEALKDTGLKYQILKGEGAFYGPKIHFDIKDSLGRTWTLATAQLDFQIPERFELEYIDENGKPQRPAIIHRAIFGTFERFIGMLTEHFQGAFPLWLAPVQTVLIPVSEKQKEYAEKIYNQLKENGIRTEIYESGETLPKRIREAELQKIPYILVVGKKEEKNESINVRHKNKETEIKIEELIEKLKKEISEKK